jgi:prepilin-type N-terminal cleavage/methylation domain-containing protein
MKKGFTLVEVLIVTAVVAVLASIAFPNFSKQSDKANAVKAETFLRAIRAAEIMHYEKTAAYVNCSSAANITALLNLTDESAQAYAFSVAVTSVTTFIATATKNTDSTITTITLDDSGKWGGNYTPLPVN